MAKLFVIMCTLFYIDNSNIKQDIGKQLTQQLKSLHLLPLHTNPITISDSHINRPKSHFYFFVV